MHSLTAFIQKLHCPFCAGGFSVSFMRDEPEEPYGLLVCPCARYPLVAGIPVLRQDALSLILNGLIEAHRFDEALVAAMQIPFKTRSAERWARRLDRLVPAAGLGRAWERRRTALNIAFLAARPAPTYEKWLRHLYLDSGVPHPLTYSYLYYRRSSPTFLAILAMLKSADFDAGPILDLCCASGHVTRNLIAVSGGEVTGVDEQFALLVLARRFLATHAHFVCADVNFSLPFETGSFRTVLCADALFDVRNMQGLARELLRVARDQGRIYLTRLLNRECDNPYRGHNPLNPAEYAHLFAREDPLLFSEREVLDRYLEGEPLSLEHSRPAQDLRRETSIAMIVTQGSGNLEIHDREVERIGGQWRVNPQYKYYHETGELAKFLEDEDYGKEYAVEKKYLPASFRLTRETSFEDLARRRLILPLPDNYSDRVPAVDALLDVKGA